MDHLAEHVDFVQQKNDAPSDFFADYDIIKQGFLMANKQNNLKVKNYLNPFLEPAAVEKLKGAIEKFPLPLERNIAEMTSWMNAVCSILDLMFN